MTLRAHNDSSHSGLTAAVGDETDVLHEWIRLPSGFDRLRIHDFEIPFATPLHTVNRDAPCTQLVDNARSSSRRNREPATLSESFSLSRQSWSLERSAEPDLRHSPIPLDSRRRKVEDFCGFFGIQPAKVSKLDDTTLPGIDLL